VLGRNGMLRKPKKQRGTRLLVLADVSHLRGRVIHLHTSVTFQSPRVRIEESLDKQKCRCGVFDHYAFAQHMHGMGVLFSLSPSGR